MRVIFQLLSLALLLAAPGCVVRNHCTPNNCNGCCDPTGMCLDGTTKDACGVRGAMCTACGPTASCGAGICLGPSTGGGAAGGGTGGGAAGGNTGGGVVGPTYSIIFLWNFAGQTCAQAAVSNVVVNVAGASTANQTVRCNTGGTDGIVLLGFRPGSYTATLEGRDATNALRFRGTARVQVVDQDVSAQVRFEPVMATGPGELLVRWSFPALSTSATPTCAQATITTVSVSANGGAARDLTCSTGEPSGMGARFQNLSGTATLDLAAADMNGFVYFRKQQQVPVPAGVSTPVTVALDWDVGSLPVRWQFRDGPATLTCAQAGVTSVYLNLRTQAGVLLYPNAGAEVPCADPTTGQATVFPYLPKGTFDVFFQAVGTGGRLFKTDQTTPPRVTVTAGQFPQLDAATPTYTMSP
ncbi:MAG: hypothetical protein IAE78_04065 [Myxococcus sp.]|nr:hypothetical protein [Myxococcus sp.]